MNTQNKYKLNLQLFGDSNISQPWSITTNQDEVISLQVLTKLHTIVTTGTHYAQLESNVFNFENKSEIKIPNFFLGTGGLNGTQNPADNPQGIATGPASGYPDAIAGNVASQKIVFYPYTLRFRRGKTNVFDIENINSNGWDVADIMLKWVTEFTTKRIVREKDAITSATISNQAETAFDENGTLIFHDLQNGFFSKVDGLSNATAVDWSPTNSDATQVAKENSSDTIAANKFIINPGDNNINLQFNNLKNLLDALVAWRGNNHLLTGTMVDIYCTLSIKYFNEFRNLANTGIVENINVSKDNGYKGKIDKTIYAYNNIMFSFLPEDILYEYVQVIYDGDGGYVNASIHDKNGNDKNEKGKIWCNIFTTAVGGNGGGVLMEQLAFGNDQPPVDGDIPLSSVFNITKYMKNKVITDASQYSVQKMNKAEVGIEVKHDTIVPADSKLNLLSVVIREKVDQAEYNLEISKLKIWLNSTSNSFVAAAGVSLAPLLETFIGTYTDDVDIIDVANVTVNTVSIPNGGNAGSTTDGQALQKLTATITVPVKSGKFADAYEVEIQANYSNDAQTLTSKKK